MTSLLLVEYDSLKSVNILCDVAWSERASQLAILEKKSLLKTWLYSGFGPSKRSLLQTHGQNQEQPNLIKSVKSIAYIYVVVGF